MKRAFEVFYVLLLVAIAAFALTLAFPPKAHAKVLAGAESQGIKVILTDEPCKLSDVVKNLPYRATWTERGKVFEGCWAAHPQLPIVMSYWSDHTVGIIPVQALHDLTEAAL